MSRRPAILAAAVWVATLATGCLETVEADLVARQGEIPGVAMSAEFGSSTIRIEIDNDSAEPIRIQWRDSAYVDGNGVSSRLILYGEADHDADGVPLDEVVPVSARAVAVTAPAGRINPATGQGRELLGPTGDEVRLVISVAHAGGVDYLDYRYRFVERD